jgi:hypothetical protein
MTEEGTVGAPTWWFEKNWASTIQPIVDTNRSVSSKNKCVDNGKTDRIGYKAMIGSHESSTVIKKH